MRVHPNSPQPGATPLNALKNLSTWEKNHLSLQKHFEAKRNHWHAAENCHMPLLAYEVAEFKRPINWFSVLVGAALAALVVFVLGL